MYCSEKEHLLFLHAEAVLRWLTAASALLKELRLHPKDSDERLQNAVLDTRLDLRLAKLKVEDHKVEHHCDRD